ncbi:amino acid-binding protein [Spirochaetia bacterium]|nr:amino acid-binding protein [Spirochaetia bacterium]
MQINQISVFLENSAGRLAEVTKTMSDAGINLRAISIADTADFGILRMIVNKQDEAQNALIKAGFTIRLTKVLVVEIDDKPGSLAVLMELFQKSNVNVEYLYSSLQNNNGKAVCIFKLNDYDKGLKIVKEAELTVVEQF